MTKAEVQENIRYNERLIRDFQNERRQLESRAQALSSDARNVSNQIHQQESCARTVLGEMDEVRRLLNKFKKLSADFQERQNKRIRAYNNNISKVLSTNFFSSYISGMKTLLCGNEYDKALRGITDAIERVNRRWKDKQKQHDSIQDQIRRLKNKLDGINREIDNTRKRIAKTDNDIAYRKQRLRYWQEQLRYATD